MSSLIILLWLAEYVVGTSYKVEPLNDWLWNVHPAFSMAYQIGKWALIPYFVLSFIAGIIKGIIKD